MGTLHQPEMFLFRVHNRASSTRKELSRTSIKSSERMISVGFDPLFFSKFLGDTGDTHRYIPEYHLSVDH